MECVKLLMFGAVNNHNRNRATLATSVLSRRTRFYQWHDCASADSVIKCRNSPVAHTQEHLRPSQNMTPSVRTERTCCGNSRTRQMQPQPWFLCKDRTGQDGGLLTALGSDCWTSVSWSVWHFVHLTGSLTKEQRAQSADAQTFKIKPW